MGCGGSSSSGSSDSEDTTKTYKLLLLGTGGCGKSTLFKTLRLKHGERVFDEGARNEVTNTLRRGLIKFLARVVEDTGSFEDESLSEEDQAKVEEFMKMYQQLITIPVPEYRQPLSEPDLSNADQSELDNVGALIQHLWSLNEVQNAFKVCRSRCQIPANMQDFFPRAKEILNEGYHPSEEDMLRCFIRTTGAITYCYTIEHERNAEFKVIDLGAQRSERNKWAPQFHDVSAVLFVVALNHYNEVLYEDESVNAMHEAVKVFSQYINDDAFKQSDLCLIFTKKDLFEQSLKDFPLSMCFGREIKGWDGPEYWEGPDYALMPGSEESVGDRGETTAELTEVSEAGISFIKEVFQQRYSGSNIIFFNLVNPLDSNDVDRLFWEIQNIVMKKSIGTSGLV